MSNCTGIREIFPELESVTEKKWVEAACKIWDELFNESNWLTLDEIPFSFKSKDTSLITHTKAVLAYALDIVYVLKEIHQKKIEINLDVLVIACILHDVDKVVATEPCGDGTVKLTDKGLDFQHGFYSAMYAEKYGLPPSIVTILIDHTTFSRLAPDSIEGIILILADLVDAELLSFHREGISTLMTSLGKISNRQKLERIK